MFTGKVRPLPADVPPPLLARPGSQATSGKEQLGRLEIGLEDSPGSLASQGALRVQGEQGLRRPGVVATRQNCRSGLSAH